MHYPVLRYTGKNKTKFLFRRVSEATFCGQKDTKYPSLSPRQDRARTRRHLRRQGAPRRDALGRAASGDDIRGDLVLDFGDAVAQLQFAFLEALQLQHVGRESGMQGIDGRVEVAMVLLQTGEFREDKALFVVIHHAYRIVARP